MSHIDKTALLGSAALVDIYDRSSDPFGNLSIVHPAHPMRKAKTIRVDSLKEMVLPIDVGVKIFEFLDFDYAFSYAAYDGVLDKPELSVVLNDGFAIIYRIAATIRVTEDSMRALNVMDAIKGLLLRRLDALEAFMWYFSFLDRSLFPPLHSDPASYREIFALSRALLSRLMPSDAYDAMLSPKSYGAALLENSAGTANNTNYAEPQVASGQLTLVPVALNQFVYSPSFDVVCVYPSKLPSLCKRYIHELFYTERVVDETADKNLYRATAERYLLISIPADYYSETNERFVAPIVAIETNGALNNIAGTFGAGALMNIELVSRMR